MKTKTYTKQYINSLPNWERVWLKEMESLRDPEDPYCVRKYNWE